MLKPTCDPLLADERKKLALAAIWRATRSYDEIARDLSEDGRFGVVTKSMVCGIAFRAGTKSENFPRRAQLKMVEAAPARPGTWRSCTWIFGHPREGNHHQCEHEALPGKSWCAAHYDRVFIKGTSMRSLKAKATQKRAEAAA